MAKGVRVALVALLLAGLGCTPPEAKKGAEEPAAQGTSASSEGPASTGSRDTLRFVIGESPRSIDPNLATESEGGLIVLNTFEGLYMHGPGDDPKTRLLPGVAKSSSVSDDGLVWTFKLRADARWSDGKPVTAKDFVYSWLRLLKPETAAEYSHFLRHVKGAEAYRQGEGGPEGVGVRAVDDTTFEVTLAYPYAMFKEITAFYATFPVPSHVVEAKGADWIRAENWVSNGPYVVTEVADKQHIKMRKNPEYWDREKVSIETITGLIIPDESAAYNAYLGDQVDWLRDDIPASELPNLLAQDDSELEVHARLGVYMLIFNVKQPPFDDVRVRKAFNLALDKPHFVKNVTQGRERPAYSLVPSTLRRALGYEGPKGPKHDLEEARRLLSEAGYPDGEGMPKVVFRYNTSENHKKVAESVQSILKTSLGVDVELSNNEWKVYLDDLQKGDFQMGRYGWIADYVDPMTFLDLFMTDNPNNNTRWSDARYDELLIQADREADADKRMALMAEAEAIWLEAQPAIPLYFYTQKLLIKPWVQGIEEQPIGVHLFKYMRLGAP